MQYLHLFINLSVTVGKKRVIPAILKFRNVQLIESCQCYDYYKEFYSVAQRKLSEIEASY